MSATMNGLIFAMFYVVSYVLMTLAGFGIIIIVIFDQI
jgi:NADH-quinone oxidoreductase subunit N